MERCILHVDLDAFFASVEQRDDPSLRGKPVIVGGPSKRGVVAAASYEARPFGVRSAMPTAEALRRCPHAIVVPPRREAYEEASEAVFAIFHRYTPLVEGISIDEAFLDVGGSRALFGDGETIARRIKAEVRAETQLVASAGVAATKFVAKIASDLGKPDGLFLVPAGKERELIGPLPIERMWGIGPKAAPQLRAHGFATIADLADAKPGALDRVLGSWGDAVRQLANGIDPRAVEPNRAAKSIGSEETFEHDLKTRELIEPRLLGQCDRVAERLVRAGLVARTVTVKLKYADFTLLTRREKLRDPVADATTLHEAAKRLLDRFPHVARGVRLTGISVSDIVPIGETRSLFPDPRNERRRAMESAIVSLRERFGEGAATRASLLGQNHDARGISRTKRRD